MRIVLDTNFLIYSVKYNIFQQLEEPGMKILLPFQALKEIEMLSKTARKGKDREAAKMALQLTKKFIKVEKISARNADDAALNLAIQEKASLATLDKGLMKKAGENGVKTVGIRQKSYIDL